MKLVANLRINYGLFYLLKCSSKQIESADEGVLNIQIVNSGMLTRTTMLVTLYKLSTQKDEYDTWTRFKNIIQKHYIISSNSFLMRKSKIVRWLNDRNKFSSTSSTSSSNQNLSENSSNEIGASMLERVAAIEDKLENLTRTVDKKLDILIQKLK